MAIIFHDTKERSELQQRIASELREKQVKKSLSDPDKELTAPKYDNENSTYLENTKVTTSLAWAWSLIGLGIVGTIIAIIMVM
ncbi:MAG: hypothetical protein LBQ11_00550 [Candidatus Nomurabacteria bacterium]|jgi:hypothetical protein|nr:hypothetical protein [Candidatus Nomurabacteria bacterium]